MITYECLVNGDIDAATRDVVTAGIAKINTERFGVSVADVSVEFTEIAEGRWFTAGQISKASMVC